MTPPSDSEKRDERLKMLRAAKASEYPHGTLDVLDLLRDWDGVGKWSRHMVYRRLAKLEASGHVDKEILFGATSIGHALWSLTAKGEAELEDQRV